MSDEESKSDWMVRVERQRKPLSTPPMTHVNELSGHGHWLTAWNCLANVGKLMMKLVIGFYMLGLMLFVILPCPTGHVEPPRALGKTTSGPLIIDERVFVEEVRVEGPPLSASCASNHVCGNDC